ncbi:nitrate/nitrite transporter [Camelliibacillus cellulosilyticus]|uniref:Lysosomal dipeptide transporter MFSD1 n=1 Tax=Camelliibacillus cellulosilyticus TaxID=2174486 RepID=A0ABV9GR50_9BACL
MEKHHSPYRWIVFTAVLLTYFFIVTQRTAPGLITDQLMKDFNVTAATIGLLSSIQFLAYAGLQIPIGILSDRFGPNFFLIIGTLLNGVGTVVYSLAPNEGFLILARLLVGVGDATIWVNVVLILSQWFKVQEFVGLIGLAGMTGSLGFLAATVPFSAWISFSGWRMSFLTVGVILCVLACLLYFVLIKKPAQIALTSTTKATSTKATVKRESTLSLLKRIFSHRQAWATFFCHFGLVGTYIGFIGSWAVPYGMHVYGLTRTGASQLIMIGLLGAIVGAPLSSWMSNKMQTIKRPYVIVHLFVFLSWLAFVLLGGKPPFVVLIILFLVIGYGNGASALTFATVRKSFPMKEVGVVSGFANTGGFISAVLLPSVFGKILDHFHGGASTIGYKFGFIIPIAFSLLGLMGGLLIKDPKEDESQIEETAI